MIRRSALEGLILEALKERLMAPDLVAEFVASFRAEINRQRASQTETHSRLVRDLADVERKLDRLIEAITAVLFSAGTKAKLDELEARKASLQQALAAPAPTPIRLHPNLADLYRQRVAALGEALRAPDTRDEALSLLRPLIDAVVLRPADRGFDIELVGDITGMMRAAQGGNENAVSWDEAARSVRVPTVEERFH